MASGDEDEDTCEEGDEEDEENVPCCDEEEIEEETLKFRIHQYLDNPNMHISGEDAYSVLECDQCGPSISECVRLDCEECGRGWVREDYTLCIIGNDVISLFPSLDSITTGKIVREEVTMSTITVEGFNTRLGLRYISMNEEYTSDLDQIRGLMPTRLTKPGIKPTMKCKWVNSKEILAEDDWVYPKRKPSEM